MDLRTRCGAAAHCIFPDGHCNAPAARRGPASEGGGGGGVGGEKGGKERVKTPQCALQGRCKAPEIILDAVGIVLLDSDRLAPAGWVCVPVRGREVGGRGRRQRAKGS